MSLATLRYEHVGKKAAESKQGAPIYDGLPSGFFEWEFRAMTRYHSTDDSEKWKVKADGRTNGRITEDRDVLRHNRADKTRRSVAVDSSAAPAYLPVSQCRGTGALQGRTASRHPIETSRRDDDLLCFEASQMVRSA